MTATMTLDEKERQLLETVAMPTLDDWRLLGEPDENRLVAEQLNFILSEALNYAKTEHFISEGDIGAVVYLPIQMLDSIYPESGLEDTEASITVARFFGINYAPDMYYYMRFEAAGRSTKPYSSLYDRIPFPLPPHTIAQIRQVLAGLNARYGHHLTLPENEITLY